MLPVPGAAAGAAAGVAVGAVAAGAVVHERDKLLRQEELYEEEEERRQLTVVISLIQEHIANYHDADILNQLHRTEGDLQALSPAFPQVKLAYDAVLKYQQQRTTEKTFMQFVCVAPRRKWDKDPRTLVCEFLKGWLQTKSEDSFVQAEEIEAHRNFCRAFLTKSALFVDRNTYSFMEMMSHVTGHLESLWQVRLRARQDCASMIKHLHKDAYNFILHAFKILLMAPTTFELPPEMYSTGSLGWLRETALSDHMLTTEQQRQIAKQMECQWATDSGSLLKRLLCSDHGSSIVASMDGMRNTRKARVLRFVIHGAENLPAISHIDAVDPFVEVKVQWAAGPGKQMEIKGVTTVKCNDHNPVWEEPVELMVPTGKDVTVTMVVSDYDEILGVTGLTHGSEFVRAQPMSADRAMSLADKNEKLTLDLSPVGDAVRAKQLEGAHLFVEFSVPSFDKDLAGVRDKWTSGDFKNSGLLFESFYETFLKAVDELNSLVYFMDILFSNALEIAQLFGDLGMVMCVDMIRPLLDEIEHRAIAVNKAIANDLVDELYREQAKAPSRRHRWFGSHTGNKLEDPEVHESMSKVTKIKTQLLNDVAKLRQLCCSHGRTAADVMMEGMEAITALMGKLSDAQGTNKFRSGAEKIQFGDQQLPAMAVLPGLQQQQQQNLMPALMNRPVSLDTPTTSMASGGSRGPPMHALCDASPAPSQGDDADGKLSRYLLGKMKAPTAGETPSNDGTRSGASTAFNSKCSDPCATSPSTCNGGSSVIGAGTWMSEVSCTSQNSSTSEGTRARKRDKLKALLGCGHQGRAPGLPSNIHA